MFDGKGERFALHLSVNFWSFGYGKDRFEAHTEAANLVGFLWLITVSDARNIYYVLSGKRLAVMAKDEMSRSELKLRFRGSLIFCILQQFIDEMHGIRIFFNG